MDTLEDLDEEAARERDLLFRRLMEPSPIGMALVGPGGRLLQANPALAALLGRDEASLAGCTCQELLHPEELEADPAWLRDLLEGRQDSCRRTVRLLRQDGALVWGDVSALAVRGPDQRVGYLCLQVLDLTAQREAQGRMHHAHRSELLGRLAGSVIQEFNNLLMGITGYAQFLAGGIPEGDPRRTDVEAILECGGRAALLSRKLLAFSRRPALMPTVFDVDDLVAGLTPVLKALAGERVDLSARRLGPGGFLRADRTLLEEALANLVLNARDAMPEGGEIRLEISNSLLGPGAPELPPSADPGEYLCLAVRDTGTGIPPELLPRLFEPFFTTKPSREATGLGLTSVREALSRSGGFVTVESQVGIGSTFSLHLPLWVEPGAPARPSRPSLLEEGAPRRALVVDDEPGVRALAARMLRKWGLTVVEAGDPLHALAIAEAEAEPFDLLLTDLVMPGMSGRTLAERITTRHPGLAVVCMSGYAPEQLAADGLLDPQTPFLAKPFRIEQLVSRVNEALSLREVQAG